jgi:exodeoxyribonuclease VII large subunit
MYAQEVYSLQVEPFDGMRAFVTGSVGLYAKGGQYQFYAKSLKAQGLGVLYERYQMLKDRLEREGLFAADRKRPIPGFVDTVGVVTSPTGAVIRDILSVSLRRDPDARILLCPVRVQGADAADEVVSAIQLLEQLDSVSVIIVARGGGSIEDLWTFNEERVVRAVAACKKPVVSAVGHETDFTLCDFAANMRAPTPSAAAEIAVPDREELLSYLGQTEERLLLAVSRRISRGRDRLDLLSSSRMLKDPTALIDDKRMALMMEERALYTKMERILAAKRAEFQYKTAKLEALNPLSVVARGYSAVFDGSGTLIKSVSQVNKGDAISFSLTDGKVYALVEKTEKTKEGRQNGGKKEENI